MQIQKEECKNQASQQKIDPPKNLYYNISRIFGNYSVSHNFIPRSKELCSKMALGEVGVSPK